MRLSCVPPTTQPGTLDQIRCCTSAKVSVFFGGGVCVLTPMVWMATLQSNTQCRYKKCYNFRLWALYTFELLPKWSHIRPPELSPCLSLLVEAGAPASRDVFVPEEFPGSRLGLFTRKLFSGLETCMNYSPLAHLKPSPRRASRKKLLLPCLPVSKERLLSCCTNC